jgi:hypothetical protein
MMVDDIQPQTKIEWLWTLDIVEFSWEILRYHRQDRVLNAHRAAAIEPTEAMPTVQIQAMRLAQTRRTGLLREINTRREFAIRVRRVMRVADGL